MAKFLANENVPGAAVHAAQQAGIDLTWVRDTSPGSDDESVLAVAKTGSRVVVTFDKDFGELAFRKYPNWGQVLTYNLSVWQSSAMSWPLRIEMENGIYLPCGGPRLGAAGHRA